jgi:hypothetical protein
MAVLIWFPYMVLSNGDHVFLMAEAPLSFGCGLASEEETFGQT